MKKQWSKETPIQLLKTFDIRLFVNTCESDERKNDKCVPIKTFLTRIVIVVKCFNLRLFQEIHKPRPSF